jgi:hypothetical protein
MKLTIAILDTVHRPAFCLKHDVSETESSLINVVF